MATAIQLDPATVEALDAVVASGRFTSRDDAIRTALYIVEETEAESSEALSPDEIALLEQRIAAADADPKGGFPAEEVFAELERLCIEDIEHQRNSA